MELHYARLLFSFKLTADLHAPHALFASRSEFEAAFRRALSCRRLACDGCRSGENCPYPATFGQEIARDPEAVKRHQKPPLPFIFEFPLLPPPPNRGKSFQVALNLIGSAVQHVSSYIAAVALLIEAGQGELLRVEAESPGGGRTEVGAAPCPALPILSPLDPTLGGPLSTETVALSFVTPLKLVHEGRQLKSFTFSHLARSLMRRISSLAYHYEGAEPPLDYRWLSLCSESIETADSDCRFVSWGGRPAGITGTIRFSGDLEPFHLLLQSGVATHLGKGASFGYGAYRILA